MRQSEPCQGLSKAKSNFAGAIIQALRKIPEVRSITFTGSFVDKAGLAGISDIDVVVVVEPLTRPNFLACKAAVGAVSPAELGLPDHRLLINDTFGPLKFDQPGVVVVHLMVYDVAGHREHVLASPFTCLDWERSTCHTGRSLRALYPTLPLQPSQFFAARRSMNNYLDDLTAGTLSYRRLDFHRETKREILERLPLDRRHQGEYAYHIVRNLVANYAKLVLKQNHLLAEHALLDFWHRHLPGCRDFIPWFVALSAIKQARHHDFPADCTDLARKFLAGFALDLEHTWHQRAVRHLFVRHAQTELNDGSFLGQRRDPPIAAAPEAFTQPPQSVYTSPALRCRQTAAALAPLANARIDARLHEIDYGTAEGMDYHALAASHPEIAAGWKCGSDPFFPGGENTAAVAARLVSFLGQLPPEPSLVVTHNVVLRCLLGTCLQLPQANWHLVPVNHLEPIEILQLDGVLYVDLVPAQITRISDALAGHLT